MIKRDYRIDSIRGLLIVMMSVAHLGTLYEGYSGQLVGFVSAAEGFVFLSGFVYSYFYYKYTINRNILIKKSFTRALVIYKYHILSLILLLVFYYFIPFFAQFKTEWMKNIYQEPLIHLLSIFLIIQQPPYFDILSMYVFFFTDKSVCTSYKR